MAEPDAIFLLRRFFEHDCWANRTVMASFARVTAPLRAVQLMSHIVGAEWLWHSRLTGSPAKFAVWPEMSVPQCEAELPKLDAAWREYLEHADLFATISYTNSKGERFNSSVLDVLSHVPMHSHYHRAQIATVMRQACLEPPYTDFIHAARTKAI